MKKRRKVREFKPGSVFYACLIYLFLYLPIFVVIAFSFNTSKMNITFEGFTLEWYGRMFENRQLMPSFFNTGLYKFEFKLKNVLSSSLYIPIVIPELVFAIALLIFFTSLNISMSMATLIIAHVTFSMPFVVITVRARLAGFDHSIEEAARDLGANELHTFWRVTLPMISPGVLSGGMLALTMSLDDVVVSFFTAGPESTTLPLKILGMVRKGVSPDVNALSTLMIVGTIVILLTSTVIQGRLERKM